MNIGISIAEESMCQIKNFLLARRYEKEEIKFTEDDYMEIAIKAKNYLKKYKYDENNPLSASKLIRQVRGLNRTNFNKVLEFARLNQGVKSELRKFGPDMVTYYFLPSYADKWEDEGILDEPINQL